MKRLFYLMIVALLLSSCGDEQVSEEPTKVAPVIIESMSHAQYVQSFTGGEVARTSSIEVYLNEDIKIDSDSVVSRWREIFTIEPSLNGTLEMEGSKKLVFYPEKALSPGKDYSVFLNVNILFGLEEDKEDPFAFVFYAIEQDIEIRITPASLDQSGERTFAVVKGEIETADKAENEKVEEILSVPAEGITLQWDHQENIHYFVLSGIEQKDKLYEMNLEWDASSIGVKRSGKEVLAIPGKEAFTLVDHRIQSGSSRNYITLYFSSPVKKGQALAGLIRFAGDLELTTAVEENTINVYPKKKAEGEQELILHQGIQNFAGDTLQEDISISVVFFAEAPQAKMLSKSGIYTGGENILIPFEAITLAQVDVEIIRIFEENMLRFYQFNKTMKENRSLQLVGRPVYQGSVDLDSSLNLYSWNRFNLDLSKYIQEEPGAIYRVNINFRRSQSLYPGAIHEGEDPAHMGSMPLGNWDGPGAESSYWDYYSGSYNWRDRDNPATDSYYAHGRRRVGVSVLSSDVGIIAKGQQDGRMLVALSSLRSGEPFAGGEIAVYSYQLQLIGSGITDWQGMAELVCSGVPYILTAKHDGMSNYLRVDRASSLSLSNFDVEGIAAPGDVKGFIYGERGVWRPGDPIHLSFILEDEDDRLPDDLPVVLEMINPKGQVQDRQVTTQATLGVYTFTTATDEQALTGHWTARVRVGDNFYEKNIPVESVKPNRLRVSLTPESERFTFVSTRGTQSMSVSSTWLHGAPARNLRAQVEVGFSPTTATFDGYNDYAFDNPTVDFQEPKRTIFDDKLSEDGKATFTYSIDVDGVAPAALRAVFSTRVYEEGGDFSINQVSYPFYPYKSYAGIRLPPGDQSRGMLLTDIDHSVDIATLDSEGNPISRQGIEISLYKLRWRWWWDKTAENLTNFMNSNGATRISRNTIDTVDGRGTWTLRINYPQWGRYLVLAHDKQSGHRSAKILYIDWPGWAGSPTRGGESASLLSVYTDKKSYNTGDTMTVNIPSSAAGRALVSVERGEEVIQAHWINTQSKMTTVEIDVTPEMSPTAYIHVSLVQPIDSLSNDSPIRMYGIVPVEIVDPVTQLNPGIAMASGLLPDKPFTIEVSEAGDKAMAYTIAVVDEGLLDLTNYRTPDPWSHFYGKEALLVRTWDLYSEVYGSFAGDFGSLLEAGGSDFSVDQSKLDQNRFKPVVIFEGPFQLEPGKSRTHQLTMPHYAGSVRTMVVATDGRGGYGSAEEATVVKQQLMVQGSLPRKAGPGETLQFPITIFSDKPGKQVELTLSHSTNVELIEGSKHLIDVGESGEESRSFTLKLGETEDDIDVRVDVSDGETQSYWETTLAVTRHNRSRTLVDKITIDGGEERAIPLSYFGVAGSNYATAELSSLPPIDLERRSRWLIRYPHGCIEQTTSAAFPQLFLGTLKLLSSSEKTDLQRNIDAGIDRLSGFQLPSGGFSYWPGGGKASDWATSYAGHFLIEAQLQGYHVPGNLLNNWANWQREQANSWQGDDQLNQAYRLFTLALLGDPPTGAMNRLREQAELMPAARWRLAAAFGLDGKKSIGRKMVENVDWDFDNYHSSSLTFGSSLRDRAMVLETMEILGIDQGAEQLLLEISEAMGSSKGYSTQTIAFSLVALAKFYGGSDIDHNIDAEYRLSNGAFQKIRGSHVSNTINIGETESQLLVRNQSDSPLYISISTVGRPAPGDEVADQRDLFTEVKYQDTRGGRVDPTLLNSGEDIIVVVSVENRSNRNMEEIALSAIFPSGWEILNTRFGEGAGGKANPVEYEDIRDDRVHSYFDLLEGEKKTLNFYINAAYRGSYYVPGLVCEEMYNPESYSYGTGFWASVK